MRKTNLFKKKCFWDNWISTFKRMKLDLYLTARTKICSTWVRDLNVRTKILGKKQNFSGLDFGNGFLDNDAKSTSHKGKQINWVSKI